MSWKVLVEGRSQTTLDLAGQLALREAWWRAPIELGRDPVVLHAVGGPFIP